MDTQTDANNAVRLEFNRVNHMQNLFPTTVRHIKGQLYNTFLMLGKVNFDELINVLERT